MANEAKRKKKADAENAKGSSRISSLASNVQQQPTIAESFMKAAQQATPATRKAKKEGDDDLDALLDADLLNDDDDDISGHVKSKKSQKSGKQSAAKTSGGAKVNKKTLTSSNSTSTTSTTAKSALSSKTESSMDVEEEGEEELKKGKEMIDKQQGSTNASFVVDEVDVTEEDMEAMRMVEKATLAKTKKKEEEGNNNNNNQTLETSILDESVMIVEGEESREYSGLDWNKIVEEVNAKGEGGEKEKKEGTGGGAVVPDFKPLTDANGSLLMYWIDAYEDSFNRPGTVFLFGYVWDDANRRWESMMVQVEGIHRSLYFFPRPGFSPDDVRSEFTSIRHQWGVNTFMSKPTRKMYAFEEEAVPRGIHDFLEVVYPFAPGQSFPAKEDLHGKTYLHVFGTSRSALETVMMEAKLHGPSFLLLSSPTSYSAPCSWCKYECKITDPENLVIARFSQTVSTTAAAKGQSSSSSSSSSFSSNTSFQMPPVPKLKVLSLKVQVLHDYVRKTNEILAVSGIERSGFDVEGATPLDKLHVDDASTGASFRPFTIFRRVPGREMPVGLEAMLKKNGYISVEGTEKALLNKLMARIGAFDPDVIAGHAITAFDLDLLLHRLAHHKISTWSKMGRVHRNQMARVRNPSSSSGSSASSSYAIREATCGRLICDTYTAATELLRSQKNYKLKTLARAHLDSDRREITSHEIEDFMRSTTQLLAFAGHILNDAYLALQLVAKLDVLPLTKQLTELGGNLWSRSLAGARAERIEYLLMHKFFSSTTIDEVNNNDDEDSHPPSSSSKMVGYILPDKYKASKGEGEHGPGGGKSTAPSYKGGLVLAPKVGLYTEFTLLLDFNSLYPSIIQEYNVCFTTIERKRDMNGHWLPSDPPSASTPRGVLPSTIRELVDKRKEVKSRLSSEKDATKRKQLDMRQLAIKLVANSMYGSLGFRNSRFYAMPMAELITRKGREALEKAKSIADSVSMDVIYGDTDSIMINTHTNEYAKVREMGTELKKKINKSFSELEIDIDGIFRSLLLLQKKKYAALVVTNVKPDGTLEVERQEKGLDLVRRDWAVLASNTGRRVLDCIFDQDGKRKEEDVEVVPGLQAILKEVANSVKNGTLPIEDFIITKSLTKRIEDYPDAANQPHVQVAKQLRDEGAQIQVGEPVQYIICIPQGSSSAATTATASSNAPHAKANASTGHLASRARAVEHVKRDHLKIDFIWYLTHQVHPSVSRLCEHIEGMDSLMIAECLGLDAAAFKKSQHHPSSSSSSGAPSHFASASQQSLSTRFAHCERLRIECRKCHVPFEYKGMLSAKLPSSVTERLLDLEVSQSKKISDASKVSSTIKKEEVEEEAVGEEEGEEIHKLFYNGHCCTNDACRSPVPEEQLENALRSLLRRVQTTAYAAPFVCVECGRRTKLPLFRSSHARCSSCFDPMVRDEAIPKVIYTQLLYLRYLFDVPDALSRLGLFSSSSSSSSSHSRFSSSSSLAKAISQSLLDDPLCYSDRDIHHIVSAALKENRYAVIDCSTLFSLFAPRGSSSSQASSTALPSKLELALDEPLDSEDI